MVDKKVAVGSVRERQEQIIHVLHSLKTILILLIITIVVVGAGQGVQLLRQGEDSTQRSNAATDQRFLTAGVGYWTINYIDCIIQSGELIRQEGALMQCREDARKNAEDQINAERRKLDLGPLKLVSDTGTEK